MKIDFNGRIGLAVVLILGLLALDRLSGRLGDSRGARAIAKAAGEMHNGELNAEDLHILAAGYYEGLRNDVPVSAVNPLDNGMSTAQSDVRSRHDFLSYEFRPNLKRTYPSGVRVTNSFGMANPEYGPKKPPHTRRIALLGDSLSVGPYGHDYVALLEDRLNRDYRTPDIQGYQILNFSVYGYSILQTMEVALEEAARFQPDVYVVAMGASLEFIPNEGWRNHVGRLVLNRVDLKYPFLQTVVAEAGVRPSDRLAVIEAKLARFEIPVVGWAMEQIRAHAASEGVRMIVVLVPGVINPDFTAADFTRLHPAIDGLGVPVIDLRDTFRSVNLSDFQVARGKDFHPNAQGHEKIFEDLYARLLTTPEAWEALTGMAAPERR